MLTKAMHQAGDERGRLELGSRELRDVRRFSHEAMATVFEIHAVHADARYAAQAAQAAFDLVDRLENELSRFRANSDITRINHLAAGESTRVSPSTMECLVIARHMYDMTNGTFDVSIGSGLASLELDADDLVVRAREMGAQIDLGGIGKGYAVDLMAESLEEWGLEASLVHGGFSSVLALDPPAGLDGWPLTLSHPRESRIFERLSVRQTALSASGLRKGDHIIDPRDGQPVRGRLAAWVTVPRPAGGDAMVQDRPRVAAIADALTTAFMLLDARDIELLCDRTPGIEAWLLTDDGPQLLRFGSRGS